LIDKSSLTKTAFAKSLGISRSQVYYRYRLPERDWAIKQNIETVLREHPSYGHKRLAAHLGLNRKRIRRVMRMFGIKPYRRRGRKYRKNRKISAIYANLLFSTVPSCPNHIWTSDFTELSYRRTKVYVATVLDIFTREIVGVSVSLRKGTPLVLQALCAALLKHPRPGIFHSDNGKEYEAKVFVSVLEELDILISRSHPGCPWENGYQESFYDKFKIDLGDPGRFSNLGELVYAVYMTVHSYNTRRIHSKLKMPPASFAQRHQTRSNYIVQGVS